MTTNHARIGRRALLLLGVASLTAASAPPRADVPAIMQPLPPAPAAPPSKAKIRTVAHWTAVIEQSWDYQY